MTVLLITIPLMVLAIAIAIVPLAATIRGGAEQLRELAGAVAAESPALAATDRRAA